MERLRAVQLEHAAFAMKIRRDTYLLSPVSTTTRLFPIVGAFNLCFNYFMSGS